MLCAYNDDVNWLLRVDSDGDAVFASTRCSDPEGTYRLVKHGVLSDVARLGRSLLLLDACTVSGNYSYVGTFTIHDVTIVSRITWADGLRTDLRTYGRQGPLTAWLLQQLLLSLPSETAWYEEFRAP